jgi:hypothetical protein
VSHRRFTRVELHGAGDIENISGGGIFVRTAVPLAIGHPVTVELRWSSDALSLGGRVVNLVSREEADKHGAAPGAAIEFDAMPAEVDKRLRALLDDLEAGREKSLIAAAVPSAANVRGLLEALSEALRTIKQRDDEIAQLKAELFRLKK